MLETYYNMRRFKSRWANKIGKAEMLKICTKVAEHFALEMSVPIEEVDDCIRVFRDYIEFYWSEPHEVLAVEQVGSKVMYEDDEFILLYETKIDLIVSLRQIPVLPIDHKHSRRRGPVHDLSNQFIGYCWMLDVRNLMVNKIGFQTSLKNEEKFTRPLVSYPKPVIDAWVKNTIWWVKMLRFHEKTGTWPQNLTSCDKYSGCIFQPVCISVPENRVFKINQLFQRSEKPWDIGAKL
jgi:hypothetical protein